MSAGVIYQIDEVVVTSGFLVRQSLSACILIGNGKASLWFLFNKQSVDNGLFKQQSTLWPFEVCAAIFHYAVYSKGY